MDAASEWIRHARGYQVNCGKSAISKHDFEKALQSLKMGNTRDYNVSKATVDVYQELAGICDISILDMDHVLVKLKLDREVSVTVRCDSRSVACDPFVAGLGSYSDLVQALSAPDSLRVVSPS